MILLVTLFFFFSQIIPLKTIKVLFGKEFYVSCNNDDCNEDDFQMKDKKESEADFYNQHFFSVNLQEPFHSFIEKHYHNFLISIPTEKYFFIIVPPPNC